SNPPCRCRKPRRRRSSGHCAPNIGWVGAARSSVDFDALKPTNSTLDCRHALRRRARSSQPVPSTQPAGWSILGVMEPVPVRSKGVTETLAAAATEVPDDAEAAFADLYRQCRDDVYAYAAGLLRDRAAAEDVTAQAFER